MFIQYIRQRIIDNKRPLVSPGATTLTPPHESFLSLTKFEKDLLLPI